MNAQGIESLAQTGRFGDTDLIHVTKGEVVIPPNILKRNTSLKDAIRAELAKDGTSINEITVGSPIVPRNPRTGLQEFFLKSLFKKVKKGVSSAWKRIKKVIDPVAKVARFIPGPWQAAANIYVKGKAALNLVKGEGGLGDFATLFTGGNVLGKGGDLATIGGRSGNIFQKLLGDTSKYTLGNLAEGIGSFFGGGTEEYIDQFGNKITKTEFDNITNAAEKSMYKPVESGNFLSKIFSGGGQGVQPTGQTDSEGNPTFIDRLGNIFNSAGNFISNVAGGIGNFAQNFKQNTGIDPALLALAKYYGDATEKALRKEAGGMQDIRKSIRPDLQVTTYNQGGFNLGYAKGGEVMDMRAGGESIGPGTGTSDDIPAMLSDGEFVMTAKANLGAGSVGLKKGKGGIMELVPQGEPNRDRGAKNMMKLMRYFEGRT